MPLDEHDQWMILFDEEIKEKKKQQRKNKSKRK